MRKRQKTEVIRSFFHLGSGLTIVLIYGLTKVSWQWSLIILGAIALFLVSGDILRQFIPKLSRLAVRSFGVIMRQEEKTNLAATTYYIIGCWFTLLLFTRLIACISILFLAIGDIMVKIIREVYQERNSRCVILKIMGVNFLVCFSLGWLILTMVEMPHPFLPSILGALGASLTEMVPKIDNFTIPIFSGLLLTFGFYLTSLILGN